MLVYPVKLDPHFVYASNQDLQEPILLTDAISTEISCIGWYLYLKMDVMIQK